jgi:hypothetical protein
MSDPVLFLNSTMTYATSVSTDEEVLVDHKGSLLSQFDYINLVEIWSETIRQLLVMYIL